MHSLPIILHLEPDGSSESPGDVEESFDDESPFFLWGPHRSVTSQTSSWPEVAFFPLCDPSEQEPPPPIHSYPKKSEQCSQALAHEGRGLQEEEGGVLSC